MPYAQPADPRHRQAAEQWGDAVSHSTPLGTPESLEDKVNHNAELHAQIRKRGFHVEEAIRHLEKAARYTRPGSNLRAEIKAIADLAHAIDARDSSAWWDTDQMVRAALATHFAKKAETP
jgi:hypothetical protein